MKRFTTVIVLALLMSLLCGTANTFASNDEPAAEREGLDLSAATEDDIILSAISELTEFWKNEMFDEIFTDTATGYLGIKNVRIIWIKDTFGEFEYEDMARHAEELFGNVKCIVSFVLFSDYMEMGGSFYLNAGVYDHVLVYKDGSMQVCSSPIKQYTSLTYSADYNAFIESVSEYDSEYNTDFYLLSDNGTAAETQDNEELNSDDLLRGISDVKAKFLTWFYTTDYNGRHALYQDVMNQVTEEMMQTLPEMEGTSGVVEYEGDLDSMLWNEYYDPVIDIMAPEFLETMKNDRLPWRCDSMDQECGLTVNVKDIQFTNETGSSFTDGIIYDFDVTLDIQADNVADIYYVLNPDDGEYHSKGQITVYEEQITKISIR